MSSRSRRLAHLVLVAPFLVGPLILRPAARPIGDALAAVVVAVAVPMAPAAVAPDEDEGAAPAAPVAESAPDHGGRFRHGRSARAPRPFPVASSAPDAGASASARTAAPDGGAPIGATPRGTIVVPASVVAQAIAKKDIGATNAKGPDGKPLGARIHGVGRYHVGLRDGDIIVSVAGMPTPTTAALVDRAMRAVGPGASTLSGRILRGDELWDVVLELPPPP